MSVAEDERTKLHHTDEAGEEVDLGVGISTVDDAGKGKELGSLVDFRPKSMFQALLGVLEGGSLFDQV